MATSATGVITPDIGTAYNPPVDLAVMADSIDTIVLGLEDVNTERSNYGVGTTSERTAALASFPDGAKWYDTTLSAEYRRVAGAWVLVPAADSYNYRWANSAARTAQTGMVAGDVGYQTDTGVVYRYSGSAWKEWESGWLTWTPTLTGVTLGTGPVTEYQYRWVGGVADFDLSIKLGTSGAFTGQPTISLPITAKALRYSSMTYDGVASGANAGGNIYPLAVLASGASTTVVTFWSTLSGAYAVVLATVPHTWAANSVLQARFRVIPA